MTATIRAAVHDLRRRAARAVLVGELATCCGWALLLGGTLYLLSRHLFGVERQVALLSFAGLLLALPIAHRRARRKGLHDEDAATWLDVRAGSTGLLVTGHEVTDARWQGRVEALLARVDSRLRVAWRPALGRVALASAFAAAAFLLEPSFEIPDPSQAFYASLTSDLEQKLDTLEETVVLDERREEQLEEQLEQLVLDTEVAGSESTLEALDRFEEQLEAEAERLRQAADEARLQLDRVVTDARLDADTRNAALAETLDALREQGFDASLPATLAESLEELGAMGLELPEGVELDAEQLEALSKQLGEMLEGKLGKLADAKLLDEGEPAELDLEDLKDVEFAEHVCDEECEAGGT